MGNLAEYVMRGRKQAITFALFFTVVPFFGWISDAIIALVTLRKGTQEGGVVLMWTLLPNLVIALTGYPQIWLFNIAGTLVVYGSASLLRQGHSWAKVLSAVVLVGILGIIGAHLWVPNLLEYWINLLTKGTAALKMIGIEFSLEWIQQSIPKFAAVATGVQAVTLLTTCLISLFFARWWQSKLYNPGGLALELHNIKLGLAPVVLLLIIILGAILGIPVAVDCLPLILMPFILAGISLLHSMVHNFQLSKLWLLSFYVLLVVFFLYLGIVLTMVALADHWLDFRQRFIINR